MTNTPMTSREVFEQWHKSEYQGHDSYSYKHDTTAYIDDYVEIAFMAWQASQAQQAQTIAELVEALEDAQESLARFTSDEGSTQKDFDTCDHVHSVLAKVKGK